MRRVLAEAPDEAFGYADPRGRAELRAALAGYLGRARAVHATAATVQVCAGAGHGLAIAFRAVAALGARSVAVEDPSSPRMREIAAAAGLAVRALPCDDLGARADALAGLGADAVVVTPAHQYPLGVTLSPRRRAELIAWACGSGGILIEDDYDGELRYDRQPVGALQALDPGRVIYVGTTSKSLAAALRVGWLVVPAQLTDAVADTIRVINAWPCSLRAAGARQVHRNRDVRPAHPQDARHLPQAARPARRDARQARPDAPDRRHRRGGHALVRMLPHGPDEHEIIARAALAGLALDGLNGYRVGDVTAEPLGPALVIGYGTPAGRSYRAAVAALGDLLSIRLLARLDRPAGRHRATE